MSDLKGKIVYDNNGLEYEFDHEHNGTSYCYPVLEFQDGSGEWFSMPGDNLVALREIHLAAPVKKLSDQVKDLIKQIEDAKVRQAEIRGETTAMNASYNSERLSYDRFMEEYGMINRIGKLMAGEPVVILILPVHPWTPPTGAGTREVSALSLRYNHDKKAWRFAKARSGAGEGHDTLELFDSVGDAEEFVNRLFNDLCGELKRMAQHRAAEVFNPNRSYTSPHIASLRKWQDKWPHLDIPKEILESEQAFLKAMRKAEVDEAIRRIAELQKDD